MVNVGYLLGTVKVIDSGQCHLSATDARGCSGSGLIEHRRERSLCKECGGSGLCEHKDHASNAKSVAGLVYLNMAECATYVKSIVTRH